jgi:hypothetical protein
MIRRLFASLLIAFTLTACGSGALVFSTKIINSANGEPLIRFTVATYEVLLAFMKLDELQVTDGTGFCKDVGGVIGTATVPPAAPVAGDIFVIAFADCVDENGTKYNGSITVEITAFTDWNNLEFNLEVIALTAEADWFGGIAEFSGLAKSLDYVVAGNAGSITLLIPVVSDTLIVSVPTGEMGMLELGSLSVVIVENATNTDITETTASGSGEISNTTFTTPLMVAVSTDPVLSQDTTNATLLCPQEGRVLVTSEGAADSDGSFASVEFPANLDNKYRIGTNLSYTELDCT